MASKRAGRAASEGTVWAHIAPDHKSGVLLEVNCESDFVAKTDSFQELGSRLAEQLAAAALETVEELLAQPAAHQPGLTLSDYVNEVIAKTGEKCQVRRFVRHRGDLVAAYIHHGGKIGVMLAMSGGGAAPEALAAAKDLAMQVAAANPRGREPGRNPRRHRRQGKGHLRGPGRRKRQARQYHRKDGGGPPGEIL